MSLFGAMFSGVSGLTAQSSAMGAVSDNITNVSTIGYKNTDVNFQTLVTKQVSSTFYSAGGVQSKPRQRTEVQGLLQASTSQTDIALSGQGFFVVNEASRPTNQDQYLYTRAGSFIMDNEGYLKNSAGFYLQGWPTDAGGVVQSVDPITNPIPNQNIVSTDYLQSVNLSRVGGTASATTKIAIGANLPASATTYDSTLGSAQDGYQKTDVQFFDSLGNANTFSVTYLKSARPNKWDVQVVPPAGTSVLTLYDNTPLTPKVYDSQGLLEFKDRPADGSQVVIDNNTYVFDNNSSVTNPVKQAKTITLANTGAITAADVGDTVQTTINPGGAGAQVISYVVQLGDTIDDIAAGLATAVNANAAVAGVLVASANAGVVTLTARTAGSAAADTFTSASVWSVDGDGDMTATDAVTATAAGTAGTYQVDISSTNTLAQDVAALLAAIKASDSDYDSTNNRVTQSPNSTTALLFNEDGTDSIVINPEGLLDSNGSPVTKQTAQYTVAKQASDYADATQITFGANPGDTETIVINGITYEFDNTGAVGGTNTSVTIGVNLADTLANLETAIEATDPQMSGNRVRVRESDNNGSNDTLVLESLPSGSYTVNASGLGTTPTEPDGTAFTSASSITIDTAYAINFDVDGLPQTINVGAMEILGFASGAADMDDDAANSPRMELDFGTLGEADGMTQFGASFTPVFIQQNGSRFGTFAGVTISTDGLVTALFDNGEIRTIFKLPVATFVNPNALEAHTGNIWNATEASGDYTLRVADTGPAGQTIQGALESSTVDIGEEFTKMIVVQRAYSASTKIIRTADEMLDELTRIK